MLPYEQQSETEKTKQTYWQTWQTDIYGAGWNLSSDRSTSYVRDDTKLDDIKRKSKETHKIKVREMVVIEENPENEKKSIIQHVHLKTIKDWILKNRNNNYKFINL